MDAGQGREGLITVAQAAARAGVSRAALYEACRLRRLAHYRLSGAGRRGRVMIRPADLDDFVESCRVEAAPAPAAFRFTHARMGAPAPGRPSPPRP